MKCPEGADFNSPGFQPWGLYANEFSRSEGADYNYTIYLGKLSFLIQGLYKNNTYICIINKYLLNMAQSLSKIYLHLIFSTKDRRRDIPPFIKEELFSCVAGKINSTDCQTIKVGGTSDHIHVLFAMGRTKSVSEIVKVVKTGATAFLKERMHCNFSWQQGYGIFSVSQSKLDAVRKYIANQEEHHKKYTFKDEFRVFLKEYGIEYDERFVWN